MNKSQEEIIIVNTINTWYNWYATDLQADLWGTVWIMLFEGGDPH